MPRRSQDQLRQQIIAGLDIISEYMAMGVEFAADQPRASGKISCYSRERGHTGDRKPSAYVDSKTGHYSESSGSKESLGLFDFAVKFGQFADWKSARDHYAAKVGVAVGKRWKAEDPLEALAFQEWTPGNERLADLWCKLHKPGASLAASKHSAGRWPATHAGPPPTALCTKGGIRSWHYRAGITIHLPSIQLRGLSGTSVPGQGRPR